MISFFTTLGIAVFAFPFLLVLSVAVIAWRAWWMYPAWAWFIVPLGAPQITFWHFTGLLFLVTSITQHFDTHEDKRKNSWPAMIIGALWPILVWTTMWWIHR